MEPSRPPLLHIHPDDDVAVALVPLEAGTTAAAGPRDVTLREAVPAGHKVALRDVAEGEDVVKYGHVIGYATAPIPRGAWVHVHNLSTHLQGVETYRYAPARAAAAPADATPREMPTFAGYRRPDGRVGTRNEVWVLNTVGCVNRSAERIARRCHDRFASVVDGVYAFPHPYGCSQLGDDLRNTQRALAGLLRHPNAGGVLLLGLGCEDNQRDDLLGLTGDVDPARLRVLDAQDVVDEVAAGEAAVAALVEAMRQDRRTACPLSDLVVGMNCGGSDAFSGLTANPLVGRITDRLTGLGGTSILTEVPEMFGAEQLLMNRARDERIFDEVVALVNRFKEYFLSHGQPIYENPSPGNRDGGLTTLEEKSLGAVQKGGQATVTQVLGYGEAARRGGLALLDAPGNDGVSATAQVVSGATMILFTTGRGTPLGFPVPTLKIATNTTLYEQKPSWLDFNAGVLVDGSASMEALADDLLALVIRVASGEARTCNELNDYREIVIWKGGVTV